MGKVDWDHLEIVEEWTPIDPSNPKAIQERKEQTELLSKLILEIYITMKKGRVKKRTADQAAFEEGVA